MKKTSTKKLVISITALLLVGVLVFCVACKETDPYAGNYQAVAEEDRNEVVADTTAKLEEIYNNGLQHIEFVYKSNSSIEQDGETTFKNDTKVTLLVDDKKVYAEIDYYETKDGDTTKFTSKVWYDAETEEAWYKVVTADQTYEAKYDSSAPVISEVQMSVVIAVLMGPMMVSQIFEQFANALEDNDVALYVDGENIKIVAENAEGNETDKGEGYLVFAKDGAFRFKLENTSEKIDGTKIEKENNFAEIVSTTKTVTMPNFD